MQTGPWHEPWTGNFINVLQVQGDSIIIHIQKGDDGDQYIWKQTVYWSMEPSVKGDHDIWKHAYSIYWYTRKQVLRATKINRSSSYVDNINDIWKQVLRATRIYGSTPMWLPVVARCGPLQYFLQERSNLFGHLGQFEKCQACLHMTMEVTSNMEVILKVIFV